MDFNDIDTKTVIRPYFEALYKGVEEFNRKIRAEAGSRHGGNSELEAQTVTPSGAERSGLSKVIVGNLDVLESGFAVLDSPSAEKEGLQYAARKVRLENPELSEEFEYLSPTLKCDFFQKEFEAGFRSVLHERLASSEQEFMQKIALVIRHDDKKPNFSDSSDYAMEWEGWRNVLEMEADIAKDKFQRLEKYVDSEDLVAADARVAAEKRLRELFPELMEQRDAERKLQFEERLGQDPKEFHADKIMESHSGQERPADGGHFGLADKIDKAVSDYYDLLFDNVQEFIGMNREEAEEYERENIGLEAKLADGGLGQSEADAIRNDIRKNSERIDGIHKFLDGQSVVKAGVELSEQVLDDSEPELTDRFNAAPVAEKYAYLVNRYMDEYRGNSEVWLDPSQSNTLADIDAFRFASEKTRELFPKIAEQYEEHKREEYRERLESDPVRLHDDLMVKYAMAHVADAGQRLIELRHDRDIFQSGLRKHEDAKPGWLKNLATLGEAGKAWNDERESLMRIIDGCENKMAELKTLREDCGEDGFSKAAGEHAKGKMLSLHPDVVEACERHMARHWEQLNEARLEAQAARQAERDNGNEETRDTGLSR